LVLSGFRFNYGRRSSAATACCLIPPISWIKACPQSTNIASFQAPCPPALAKEVPQICVDANGFDRVAFHRQFDADVLVFFRTHLTNAPP